MSVPILSISRLHSRITTNIGSFHLSKLSKQCAFEGSLNTVICQSRIANRNLSILRNVTKNKYWSNEKSMLGLNYSTKQAPLKTPVQNPLQIKTNVKNNVILYRFEKPLLYKVAAAFGVMALIGCLAMADNVYIVLCKDLFAPGVTILQTLWQHILPLTAIAIGLIAGPAICICVWFVTIRSVKYIILRKGGQDVTIVTYHPIKGETVRNIPLDNLSCLASRDGNKGYVPVKIRNHKFNLMLDKSGHFVNPDLFDATVGARRFE